MESRISILHDLSMDEKDPFLEGLRIIISQRQDLTEAGVSVAAGLDNSTVRKLLSGKNASPRIETAEKISRAMGYDLSTVIDIGRNRMSPRAVSLVEKIEKLSPEARAELESFLEFKISASLAASAAKNTGSSGS